MALPLDVTDAASIEAAARAVPRAVWADLYAASRTTAQVLYVASLSGIGSHALQIRLLGTKNTKSSAKREDIDAFLVLK